MKSIKSGDEESELSVDNTVISPSLDVRNMDWADCRRSYTMPSEKRT